MLTTDGLDGGTLEQAAILVATRGGVTISSCDLVAAHWREGLSDPYFGKPFSHSQFDSHTAFVKTLGIEFWGEHTRWSDAVFSIRYGLQDKQFADTERWEQARADRCRGFDYSSEEVEAAYERYNVFAEKGEDINVYLEQPEITFKLPKKISVNEDSISNELVIFLLSIPFCCKRLLGVFYTGATFESILCTALMTEYSTAYLFFKEAGVDMDRMRNLLIEDFRVSPDEAERDENDID